jgi:hypothetical protein
MAAPSSYTPAQQAAMAELINDHGQTLAEAKRTLAHGYADLEPFEPSRETIAHWAKKQKIAQAAGVDGLQLADALDALGRKSLVLIGRRLAQVEDNPAKFDATEVLTIMRALTEAKGLIKAKRSTAQENTPSWLESMPTTLDAEPNGQPNNNQPENGSLPAAKTVVLDAV